MGWTHDLTAPDDVVRDAALARLDAARTEAQEALARYDQAWVHAFRTGTEPLFCEPAVVAARELHDEAGALSAGGIVVRVVCRRHQDVPTAALFTAVSGMGGAISTGMAGAGQGVGNEASTHTQAGGWRPQRGSPRRCAPSRL